VGVSDADKERMRRLAVHFRDAETDEEPDPDVRRLRIDAANRWRVAHGINELCDEDEDELPS
jgi:hypothetical protein